MANRKIVDMEDKLPQLQKQRKMRAKRRFILYLSVFIFLIGAILYFQTGISDVHRVQVNGNDTISEEEIINLSNITSEVKMWNLSAEERAAEIENHEAVSSVSIQRSWPTTVVISVEEHEITAFLVDEETITPVLSTGTLYQEAEGKAGEAPMLHGFGNERIIETAAQELNQMSGPVKERISDIIYDPAENDNGRITVLMNDGNTVSSTLNDFSTRMESYPSVAQQIDEDAEGIIHMRVNPYFESFEAPEQEESVSPEATEEFEEIEESGDTDSEQLNEPEELEEEDI